MYEFTTHVTLSVYPNGWSFDEMPEEIEVLVSYEIEELERTPYPYGGDRGSYMKGVITKVAPTDNYLELLAENLLPIISVDAQEWLERKAVEHYEG